MPQLCDGGQVWLGRGLGHASFRSVSLRQRERNRADSHKQKQIKRASDKMRFDGGVSFFFHIVAQMGARSLGIKALYQLPTGKTHAGFPNF